MSGLTFHFLPTSVGVWCSCTTSLQICIFCSSVRFLVACPWFCDLVKKGVIVQMGWLRIHKDDICLSTLWMQRNGKTYTTLSDDRAGVFSTMKIYTHNAILPRNFTIYMTIVNATYGVVTVVGVLKSCPGSMITSPDPL